MMISDEHLVDCARRGDSEAFGELVERYRQMVYGFAFHLTGDFDAAQDLAQEAFIQAYLKLAQLREPKRFSGWLRRIVLNVQRMAYRRQKLVTVALEEKIEQLPQAAQPTDVEVEVREALGRLRESDRLALTLHYVDGYSCSEIADFLTVQPKTVKMRLARARRNLREEITSMVEDTFKQEQLPEDFTAKTLQEALCRGEEALSEDDYEVALNAFAQAAVIRPDSAEAHAGLGAAWLMKSCRKTEAQECGVARAEFEEALRLDPLSEAALIGLAETETDKRNAYEKALDVLPTSAELRYRLAWQIHENGETEAAIGILSAMLNEAIPAAVRIRIHNNLGCFYHDKLGDFHKGREHLHLAAETADTEDAKVPSFFHWRVYAWVALRDHQWQEAIAAGSHVLDAAPTDFERRNLLVLLAAANVNLGYNDQAIQHLEAAATTGAEPDRADKWRFGLQKSSDPLEWVRGNLAEYFGGIAGDPQFREIFGIGE